MPARLEVIEVVVADMARSLAFYRRLGLDVPPDADQQPHVEASLPAACAWPGTPSRRSARSTPSGRLQGVAATKSRSPSAWTQPPR